MVAHEIVHVWHKLREGEGRATSESETRRFVDIYLMVAIDLPEFGTGKVDHTSIEN
jgi:hypothetical protein